MSQSSQQPKGPFVAALDQGTTSTRCLVFDSSRHPVVSHRMEHAQITPKPGWLSHDPAEIASNSLVCLTKAAEALQKRCGAKTRISALGITNQRETTVAWDAVTGRPLCNAVVWSDARTASVATALAGGNRDFARDVCGLPCSTYFAGVKMRWMLENEPEVQVANAAGRLRFGTIDTWLIWTLTKGSVYVTDCTNASRTMLMDIRTLQWSEKMLKHFKVSRTCLPKIISCSEHIATVDMSSLTSAHPWPLPLTGCIGDQQGALVGQLCFAKGNAKNTYGTGCFLLANVGPTVPPTSAKSGLLATVGFKIGSRPAAYALEGSIAGAGSTIQWLRDRLQVIRDAKDSAELAASVPDTGGVVFVPAFGGLLAPYWDPDARGTIVGMSMQTTKAHITRAVLQAIAVQAAKVLEVVQAEAGVSLRNLAVDGGMVANTTLMQLQADALGLDVHVPDMLETTAAGAAICASLVEGLWGPLEALSRGADARVVSPRISPAARKRDRQLWEEAVQRSVGWAKL